MENEVKDIKISSIDYYKGNRDASDEGMSHLIESIRSKGIMQPIVVTRKGNRYALIAGHRRLNACKKLGYEFIKASIREGVSDKDINKLNLIENIHRENITQSDLGIAIKKMIEDEGMTPSEIAAVLNFPLSRIKNAIACMTTVSKKIRDKVEYMGHGSQQKRGKIGSSVAVKIGTIERHHRIGKRNQDKLSDMMRQDEYSSAHLNHLALLLSQGVDFKDAKNIVEKTRIIKPCIAVYPEQLKALQRKYGNIKMQNLIGAMVSGVIRDQLDIPGIKNIMKLKSRRRLKE